MNSNGNMRRNSRGGARRHPGKKRFPLSELLLAMLSVTVVFVIIWTVSIRSGKTPYMSDSENTAAGQETSDSAVGTDGTPDTGSVQVFDPNAYTEVTLLSGGDIMYHQPQLDNAYDSSSDTYDFYGTYKYIKDIVSAADYAVVNFESTLAGADWGYSGYPVFNTPDSAIDAIKDAGFDMLLLANNHIYDTGMTGVTRTQQVIDEKGLDYIGARKTPEEKSYKNVQIGNVTVGMLNSSDDLSYGATDTRTLNGIALGDGIQYLDLLNHSLLEEFYTYADGAIQELRESGAELIIYYIHWGSEYYTTHNDTQEQIAQRLCDLGVDVIIGGHPHVVQDAQLLTSSTDPSHSTLCFYSLGNLVSNQNRLTLPDIMNCEYTENGLFVQLTIRKYDTGEVIVSEVDTIPLWVHRHTSPENWRMQYEIVPIKAAIADPDSYGLNESTFGLGNASAAYEMTNATLGGIVEAFAATVAIPTGEN